MILDYSTFLKACILPIGSLELLGSCIKLSLQSIDLQALTLILFE